MKTYKMSLINKVCIALILIFFVIAAILKSSVSFSDLIKGNFQVDIIASKEIAFNVCMGIIASAILTLFIEWSNKRTVIERNMGIKKVIMRKFSFLATQTLWELSSGTDRDLLSVIHNYHHLEFLASERLTQLKAYGEYFIENYTDIFEGNEIALLNKINLQCQVIQGLTEEAYKAHMLSFDAQLSRYYSSKKYEDLLLGDKDKAVNIDLKTLDGIVACNEKHIKPLVEMLTELKNQMPYIFDN